VWGTISDKLATMKNYISPSIMELGSVQDLTLGGGRGGPSDDIRYIIPGTEFEIIGTSGTPLPFPPAP